MTAAGPADRGATGRSSARTAELTYHGAAQDEVLAAGIADERLEPEVLEAAIRDVIATWVTAAEEGPAAGAPEPRADLAPAVTADLLRPGGPGARTRLVLRQPRIDSIGLMRLRTAPGPTLASLLVVVRGGRCIQDRDTGEAVSGDLDVMTWFHQFWDVVRDGPPTRPWRLALRAGPNDRESTDLQGAAWTTGQETTRQYRERTGADDPPPAPPGRVRPFRVTCGFVEHYVYTGGGVAVTARLAAAPGWDDAVQLVLPAVFASLTRSTGLSDWRPTISSLDVLELLG